ncbi:MULTISPECIES: deoxyribose-phosphate aldolase [Roseivirga]|uniref:Deoxyribose-phosphate aldolase n=1 Tax=Roseivirga spongicola TaxID=333140 RepID=A0A150XFD4_9BACT|nr:MULTISPECIES: deoxyribose-phosphate aldolase [Roseivirga]KYG77411.1 2-deoxyribose-5-phosphate aldolase [Roseivirga spongicola]MBO6661798.1 deoxyribose-phosphate aldolase [Roseivirga sp.]MBO6908217.1 deoxyribose-phosphate aldolase [Roseivirga sp.]WPZ11114.1 deoxyribose-phosphate aldolase [Roseivirga spongicola]
MDINQYIEHTALKPTLVGKDVDLLIAEAKEHRFLGVCVPPFWVKKTARELADTDIQLVTVIGFPLGYNQTEVKELEIKQAIEQGANELDIVMNISAFKDGMPWVKIELAKCAHIIHEAGCLMKVIIETAYLTDEEIIKATKLCSEAGTDFVKTSTGFAGAGAKVEHIKLMRENAPSNVGIKASGGIKTLADAQAMINAGADRLGTSSGVEIMQQYADSI